MSVGINRQPLPGNDRSLSFLVDRVSWIAYNSFEPRRAVFTEEFTVDECLRLTTVAT